MIEFLFLACLAYLIWKVLQVFLADRKWRREHPGMEDETWRR